ncbi:MAG: hypothetical protein AAFP77_19265 [Bacteroidota bacterium]
MDHQHLLYQESGKFNPTGLLLSILAFVLLSIVLGYVYVLIMMFIPLIYFNVLITIGLGILLGYLVRVSTKLSHNRNAKSRMILAAVLGLLVTYFMWVAYLLYIANGAVMPSISEYLSALPWIVTDPGSFFDLMSVINMMGAWSIFGLTFSGILLALVWLAEVLIIIGAPVLSVFGSDPYPYSEAMGKWYPKYTLSEEFAAVSAPTSLINDLQEDPVKTIEELGMGTANYFSRIHVFYLPEEKDNYLTFEKVTVETGEESKEESTIILNNYRVDKATAAKILEVHKNKQIKMAV